MDILKPSRKIKGWIMYLTVEPPQRPLSSVPKVAVVERFNCSRTCLMGHSAKF